MHNALEEEVEKLQDKVRSLTLEQRVNSAYKEKTRQLFEQVCVPLKRPPQALL
jgi:hypothetical protein